MLVKLFGKVGKVVRVTFPEWKTSKKRRGFAIVEYAASASVAKALEFDGTVLDGKKLLVLPLKEVINKPEKPRRRALPKRPAEADEPADDDSEASEASEPASDSY